MTNPSTQWKSVQKSNNTQIEKAMTASIQCSRIYTEQIFPDLNHAHQMYDPNGVISDCNTQLGALNLLYTYCLRPSHDKNVCDEKKELVKKALETLKDLDEMLAKLTKHQIKCLMESQEKIKIMLTALSQVKPLPTDLTAEMIKTAIEHTTKLRNQYGETGDLIKGYATAFGMRVQTRTAIQQVVNEPITDPNQYERTVNPLLTKFRLHLRTEEENFSMIIGDYKVTMLDLRAKINDAYRILDACNKKYQP
ncbi:MAG: hypothetical protein WC254_07335 [Candidatus Woesearchaeota archaeon]|jgi:hypothetical protein